MQLTKRMIFVKELLDFIMIYVKMQALNLVNACKTWKIEHDLINCCHVVTVELFWHCPFFIVTVFKSYVLNNKAT